MRGLGIRAVLRVPDSLFEVVGLNIEDTMPIEFARFLLLVGLNSGEKFHIRRRSALSKVGMSVFSLLVVRFGGCGSDGYGADEQTRAESD
jgi:hypothetical protein